MIWLLAACPPPMPCTGVQGCPPPAAEIESVPLAASGIPSNANRVVVLYCAETELPESAFSVAVDGTASTFILTHLAYPVPGSFRGAIQIEPDEVAASSIALTFSSSLGPPVTVAVNAGDDTIAPAAPEIVRFELTDLSVHDDDQPTGKTYGFELELASPSEPNVLFVIDAFGESTFRTYATMSTSLIEYGVVANPGDTLELHIRAMDAAGNVSQSTDRAIRTPKGGGCGCATTEARPSWFAALTSLAALLRSRAARRSIR